MRLIITVICTIQFITHHLEAQNLFYTKSGSVSFYSKAPLEDIEAHNTNAVSIMDVESGAIEFAILIKAFKFEKALMQEHFNENYLESSKYPKATFKGNITNLYAIDFSNNGKYSATIEGKMTIHGVARKMTIRGQFIVDGNEISGSANFPITIADHDIRIPKIVRDNIAQVVKVYSSFDFKQFRKAT